MISVGLFGGPLQHHLILLDHTSEECLRLLRPLLDIVLTTSELLRDDRGLSHRLDSESLSKLELSRDCLIARTASASPDSAATGALNVNNSC